MDVAAQWSSLMADLPVVLDLELVNAPLDPEGLLEMDFPSRVKIFCFSWGQKVCYFGKTLKIIPCPGILEVAEEFWGGNTCFSWGTLCLGFPGAAPTYCRGMKRLYRVCVLSLMCLSWVRLTWHVSVLLNYSPPETQQPNAAVFFDVRIMPMWDTLKIFWCLHTMLPLVRLVPALRRAVAWHTHFPMQ